MKLFSFALAIRLVLFGIYSLAILPGQVQTTSAAEPAPAAVHYTGRWDFSDKTTPWCAWQGSSFQTSCRGTGLKAAIRSDREDYLRVIVDGDQRSTRKIKLEPGRRRYQLVANLTTGLHCVEVVKETYGGESRMYLERLSVTDGKLVPTQRPERRLKIQFYGDSNLAGHSLEHEKNNGGLEFTGCHFTCAGITARMLDAEYQNVSVGGARILGRANSVLSFYDKLDFYHDEPKWQFTKFPVDICVVNIGANNVGQSDKTSIINDYLTLLSAIRQAHPHAHIVVMNGFGWDRDEPANYTQEVVNKLADKNMSRVVFPWLFNEWHGCEYDHAGMARVLCDHLSTINPDWKPVREMDVVDGYGKDGDVANGSFEQVAPLGGFGWRYFQDGITRVHSPEQSPAGEWFLRIPEGSETHQPNPAHSAQRCTFHFQLRSADKGQATIRVEFRDQQYRNEIKDSAKDFKIQAGAQWLEHSVSVQSPAPTGDQSHDVWQIILRIIANEGTIDIDNVKLTSPNEKRDPAASTGANIPSVRKLKIK